MTIALGTALSGLKAAQRSLDIISSNISNASTEGYTRKILPQEALIVNGESVGVRLQSVIRKVDMALIKDLVKQISVRESVSTREAYLSRIQDFHGASDAQRSVSAMIGNLSDSFAELSTAPESSIYLQNTLTAAQRTADTFNNFSDLIGTLRTQTESDIKGAVIEVNKSLEMVADLNRRIAVLDSRGESTANLEDQRDVEVRNISKYMEVSSYVAENKKLILMTKQGNALADETAHTISFNSSNVLPGSYYPGGGLNGLTVEGVSIELGNLGGMMGSLFEMRDKTLPTYEAQMDELAQKMAERFDQLGLRLFTDENGSVPASTTPPAPVSYVGFAGRMRVNEDIIADPSLLRSGTKGQSVQPGSSEMVRKISQFAFSIYAGQQGTGTANISAGTVFAATGMTQSAQLVGTMDITDYTPGLDDAPNITAPSSFNLTIGATAYAININPGDTAADLVNNINAAVGSPVADLNGLGQLRLNTTDSITIGAGTLGAAGLADLGLAAGTTPAQNPTIRVQVGTESAVNIPITPTMTGADLVTALNAVPGLTAALGPGGELVVTPRYGGELTIQNITGQPMQALGMALGNVPFSGFRQTGLGPDGTLSTGLVSNAGVSEFARSAVTAQSQDHSLVSTQLEKEVSFYDTLSKRNSDQTGVDIDQELSELIRVQSAYSAAARMITAAEKMMDELMAAFQ